jgi:nicotinamide riboside transporter PnuC
MTNYIGIIGATIILVLFLLNQFNKLKNNNIWYDGGNFVGSVLLAIYAVLLNSTPFLILNFIWAVFSLRDVVKYFYKKI